MSDDDRLAELAAIPLFRNLTNRHLKHMATRATEMVADPGQRLITEGQGNQNLYLVQEGEIEVSVGGVVRRTVGPGEFLGEISMVTLRPATATATAVSACRLFVLSHAGLNAAVNFDRKLLTELVVSTAQKRREDISATSI